jgi:hypothetical protein
VVLMGERALKWEQKGDRTFCIELSGERTERYEAAYEEAAAWCLDQFDRKDWSRFRFGTWKITFLNDADAVAFRLRWC